MATKVCSKCRVEKLLSEFGKYQASKDGHRFQCKICRKQYYEANKEKISEQKKQYREANKEKISEHKKQYQKTSNNRNNI
jgi:transposase-like protein